MPYVTKSVIFNKSDTALPIGTIVKNMTMRRGVCYFTHMAESYECGMKDLAHTPEGMLTGKGVLILMRLVI